MISYNPNCRICGGKKYITKCESPSGEPYVVKCSCFKKFLKDQKLELKLEKANLGSETFTYDIAHYKGTQSVGNIELLRRFIDQFDEKYHKYSLYFYSNIPLSQRSQVARWVGKELIKKDKTVAYTLLGDLLKSISNIERDPDNTELMDNHSKIKLYEEADLLIIEDAFDPKRATIYKSGFQLPFYERLLKKRMELNKKSNIFISDTPPDKVKDSMGDLIGGFATSSYYMEFLDSENDFDIQSIFS